MKQKPSAYAYRDGLPDVDNMHLGKNEDGGLTLERNTTDNGTLQ